jgi:hypothetical protein
MVTLLRTLPMLPFPPARSAKSGWPRIVVNGECVGIELKRLLETWSLLGNLISVSEERGTVCSFDAERWLFLDCCAASRVSGSVDL